MSLDNTWFTEACEACGSAFSLKITGKLHEEQSAFQRIEVYDTTEYGRLMVIDGFTMLTDRDNFLYHEMMTHPALFIHPNPENVLIIGGGDCGTLKEVLKHPEVKTATQVDIDERVTRVAEQFFPALCSSNNDPRASLQFEDGIKWVKDAAPGSLDIIIVDSTDPVGPAEGLFNKAFYQDCCKALKADGLLVQQSESPLSHITLIKEMREAMLNAGFKHCHTFDFPQPIYPSGWWSATIASKQDKLPEFRDAAIKARNFDTKYYCYAVQLAAMEQKPLLQDLPG